MAARGTGKKSKAIKTTARKAGGTASKRAKKKPGKQPTAKARGTVKATAKKSAARGTNRKSSGTKSAAKKTTAKARPAPKKAKPAPPGSGNLVHTRLLGVAKRLLGPVASAGGDSASGGISHTNPARSAMLKRLLG